MRFNSNEEREELIKSFDEKAKQLTVEYLSKGSIPAKTKVRAETITEIDENISDEDIKNKICAGNIYVAYIKQPNIISSTQIVDKATRVGELQAGFFAWDAMVIPAPISSIEVEDYNIKLGLCWRLSRLISLSIPDLKKN